MGQSSHDLRPEEEVGDMFYPSQGFLLTLEITEFKAFISLWESKRGSLSPIASL